MSIDPKLIWFLIGLALVLSEFLAPGVILVFFGMGAWTVAVTTWLGLTTGWTGQLLVFGIASVVYLVLLRRWFKDRLTGFEGPHQDPHDNIDEFDGQVVTVTEAIAADTLIGKVEFKGAAWTARAEAAVPAGRRVRIRAVESTVLFVESL